MKLHKTSFLITVLGLASRMALATSTTDELLAQYAGLCERLSSRITSSIATNGFTDVSGIYAAGFIHSPSNVTVLLANIELPGLNEPDRWYGFTWDWGEGNEGSFPTGIVAQVSNGLILSSPVPLLSRPPTPAVGALTQMPVPWAEICAALEQSPPTSRRTALLAWVAASLHPEAFWTWMQNAVNEHADTWGRLYQFADANLHNRKPFSMRRYETYLKHSQSDILFSYAAIISELRDKANLADISGNAEEYAQADAALAAMGQTVIPVNNEIVEQVSESFGPTNITVITEQTTIPWED